VATLAGAMGLSPVLAAPVGAPPVAGEPQGADAMTQLLVERGLVPAAVPVAGVAAEPAPPSLAQQVRDRTSELVVSAMNFLGVPYRRGGNDADTGFDCSGFTKHLFEMTFGLVLPRRVDDQANAAGLVKVQRQELQPGDLVFFNTLRRTFSHVGIYVGEGRFIHAPRTGAEVRVEDMRGTYWNQRFTGARRVADASAAAAPRSIAPDPGGRATARPAERARATPSARAVATPPVAPAEPPVGPQSAWQP
jgi:hypothetical protein